MEIRLKHLKVKKKLPGYLRIRVFCYSFAAPNFNLIIMDKSLENVERGIRIVSLVRDFEAFFKYGVTPSAKAKANAAKMWKLIPEDVQMAIDIAQESVEKENEKLKQLRLKTAAFTSISEKVEKEALDKNKIPVEFKR